MQIMVVFFAAAALAAARIRAASSFASWIILSAAVLASAAALEGQTGVIGTPVNFPQYSILTNERFSSNTFIPKYFKLIGREIEVRVGIFANAPLSIAVTELGMVTEVRRVFANARTPMLVTELGMVTEVSGV